MNTTKAVGSFESVSFPEFPLVGTVWAKIDTGAYTGALHCTKIYEEQLEEGVRLHFSPFDHPETDISTSDFFVKSVKSSNGEKNYRYFINTSIVIQGTTYPISLSLADRSEMKWPVLIGRTFLYQQNFLVDVRRHANVS